MTARSKPMSLLNALTGWLSEMGVLRATLAICVISLILIAPFAGGRVVMSGWAMITTLIAPTFYVIVVFVLPLDMVMTWIFMSDKTSEARARYQRIIWTEALLLVALLICWAPFVGRLVGLVDWD